MKTLTIERNCPLVMVSQTENESVRTATECSKNEVRTATSSFPENSPYVKNGKVIGIPFHSISIPSGK